MFSIVITGPKKVLKSNDTETRILKRIKIFSPVFLPQNFKTSLNTKIFLEISKRVKVAPIFKKNDKKYKNNHRPASILSNISKVYERCMQK